MRLFEAVEQPAAEEQPVEPEPAVVVEQQPAVEVQQQPVVKPEVDSPTHAAPAPSHDAPPQWLAAAHQMCAAEYTRALATLSGTHTGQERADVIASLMNAVQVMQRVGDVELRRYALSLLAHDSYWYGNTSAYTHWKYAAIRAGGLVPLENLLSSPLPLVHLPATGGAATLPGLFERMQVGHALRDHHDPMIVLPPLDVGLL